MACCCSYRMGQTGLLEPENAAAAVRFNPLLCLANALLTPFLLAWHSLRIYVVPCIAVVLGRLGCFFCSRLCARCSCWRYTDADFPPTEASLGAFEARKPGQTVVWKRGAQLTGSAGGAGAKTMRLFDHGVAPSDIAQGALGDCWLLSALASLAEFPGAIEKAFHNREYSARGKYSVRLYDRPRGRFVTVVVDDLFPCDEASGAPLFTQPNNGEELWAMILEKAFAKLCGSYAALEGGHTLFALEALTGEKVYKFHRGGGESGKAGGGGEWKKFRMEHEPTAKNRREVAFRGGGQALASDAMFDLVKKLDAQGCVIGAGTLGKDATLSEGRGDAKAGGIVPGHAYTVIAVKEVVAGLSGSTVRLLKIRNPWGSFEWKGAWGDASAEWGANPLVRAQLRPSVGADAADDGIFFMSWEDFVEHFDNIDVCLRTSGIDDLALDVKEELGTMGPCVGCLCGCVRYWLLCQGCWKMWCGRTGADKESAIREAEVGDL